MQPLQADDPGRIGPYALHARLGRGAMGVVYLGKSPGGRPVAVKLARPELADNPEFRERFRREVEMARSVGGFWTAAVVDADPDATLPWLATEYVAGPNLQQAVVAHGPLPEPAVRRLAAGLTEALAAIHRTGLVHRDLKPSNVLLGTDGPRVIDFGISQALEHVKLTATGAFLGTPGFLSPEQIVGGGVGPPSDVFSLGAVLAYAATGRGPFGDGQTSALVYRAVHAEPVLDGVPEGLRQVVAACLQRDPSRRPTPGQLLGQIGAGDVVRSASPEWLPPPVQTLVEQHRTELVDNGLDGRAKAGTAVVPVVDPTPLPPTRPYTAVVMAPTSLPPSPGPVPATHSRGVEFRTSRSRALLWGSTYLFGALFMAGVVDTSVRATVRLTAFACFVLLAVAATRRLRVAARVRHTLAVGAEGLAVTKGRRRWQVPWRSIARSRVVDDHGKPWMVLWFVDGLANPNPLAGGGFRSYHGGVRVYPVAHGRRAPGRSREVRELRAALGWHGPHAYDGSP